jgi:hypothetical protein
MASVHVYICSVELNLPESARARVSIRATANREELGAEVTRSSAPGMLVVTAAFSRRLDVADGATLALEVVVRDGAGREHRLAWTANVPLVAEEQRQTLTIAPAAEARPRRGRRRTSAEAAPRAETITVIGMIARIDEPLRVTAMVPRTGTGDTGSTVAVPRARRTARRAATPTMRVWACHDGVLAAWTAANGWSVVLEPKFSELRGLFRQLNSYRFGGGLLSGEMGLHDRIEHLGIVAHGPHGEPDLGTLYVGPATTVPLLQSNRQTRWNLRLIGQSFVTPDGRVTLFSCAAAAGRPGTNLMRALSLLWPGRTVTGFVTSAFVDPQWPNATGNLTDTLRTAPISSLPSGFPRVDTEGPSAMQARDGRIVRWPDPVELWRLYQHHYPRGADEVASDARRGGMSPFRRYALVTVQTDPENPNLPEGDP